MRTFSFSLALALVVPALACEVETLDVGDNHAGAAGTAVGGNGSLGGGSGGDASSGGTGGSAGTGGGAGASATGRCETDAAFEYLVGRWEGFELDASSQPLEPVRLQIRAANATSLCGSFLHGELDEPPVATDPDAHYPPEPWSVFETERDGLLGVEYEISGAARGDGARISISGYELWEDWCAMQAPVFGIAGNAYQSCIPDGPGNTNGDVCTVQAEIGEVTYTAAKCSLCRPRSSVCSCTEFGCAAKTEPTKEFEFAWSEEDGTPILTAQTPRDKRLRLQRVD